MAYTIQFRRGLESELTTLSVGEPGFCTDTKKLYIGDGTSPYLINDGAASISSDSACNSTAALTSANTWMTAGVEITLPTAGTYFVIADVHASIVLGTISARLYDYTNSAAITNSERMVAYDSEGSTATIHAVITVTGSTLIQIQGYRTGTGAIYSTSSGRTQIHYLRLD